MAASYRSYVIRVRRPADSDAAVRLDLEDLLGGRRVAVLGEEARSLADRLVAIIGAPKDAEPDTAAIRDPEVPPHIAGTARRASPP